jgi:uncharacterized protein YutE (UPF0331/DUF86 family)
MRLELYQAETARIATEQSTILKSARHIIMAGRALTGLEQNGVLHALQVIIENAIGKAKHWLKARDQVVPISGYDAFKSLASIGLIAQKDLAAWNVLIGLRNRIVHDYMNIDIDQVLAMIREGGEQFVIDFLLLEHDTSTS